MQEEHIGDDGNYAALKPSDVPVLSYEQFNSQLVTSVSAAKNADVVRSAGIVMQAAPKAGMSCSEVCAKASSEGHPMVFKEEFLYTANTCAVMSKHFDCSGGCHSSQNG